MTRASHRRASQPMSSFQRLTQRLPAQTWMWTRMGMRLTTAGIGYLVVWLGLLVAGLYQQVNLVLLTAGLAAGPVAASFIISWLMLRKLSPTRRPPAQLFEGSPCSSTTRCGTTA